MSTYQSAAKPTLYCPSLLTSTGASNLGLEKVIDTPETSDLFLFRLMFLISCPCLILNYNNSANSWESYKERELKPFYLNIFYLSHPEGGQKLPGARQGRAESALKVRIHMQLQQRGQWAAARACQTQYARWLSHKKLRSPPSSNQGMENCLSQSELGLKVQASASTRGNVEHTAHFWCVHSEYIRI